MAWVDVGRRDVRLGWTLDLPPAPPERPCEHGECHRASRFDGLCGIHWWRVHGGTATTRSRYRRFMTAADAALERALAIIEAAPLEKPVSVNPQLDDATQHVRRYVRQFLAVTDGHGAETAGTARSMTITVTDRATAAEVLRRWYADFTEGADAAVV